MQKRGKSYVKCAWRDLLTVPADPQLVHKVQRINDRKATWSWEAAQISVPLRVSRTVAQLLAVMRAPLQPMGTKVLRSREDLRSSTLERSLKTVTADDSVICAGHYSLGTFTLPLCLSLVA